MVFWDLPGWGLGSVGMGTSLCSSLLQSPLSSWLWSSLESFPFCWVLFLVCQSHLCFVWVQFGFGLVSLFMVHDESPIIVVFYLFTYDVLIGSFSDMIFYLSIVTFFSGVSFTYLVLMRVMLSIWYIFSLIYHDHFGLTYHGGYWAYWHRIRRST